MDSDKTRSILEFIFDKIYNFRKWKECLSIPFQNTEDYNQLRIFFEDIPKVPLTTINGEYIDIISLIQVLLSLNETYSINISLFQFAPIEDNIIGIKISFGQNIYKIDIDCIKLILSTITRHDISVSDFQSQYLEGIIKVDNGDELLVFSFDFDTFTINGYSSISKNKKDFHSISFVAKCNIFDEFYSFTNKFMLSMVYYPNKSLCVSLGSNSLLLNFPKTQNRFIDIAEYLFPGSIKHVYSHTEKSEEINALSSATIIHLAFPTNMSSNSFVSNSLNQSQKDKCCQQLAEREKFSANSIFMLFTFLNNIPQESNCQLSLDLLSSVTWSDLSISFVPMPIGNKNPSKKINENSSDEFNNYIENARNIPYCTCSTIVGKPGTVIIAFLNTTKESAKAVSRTALVKAFEKMQGLMTKSKSYVRLNRIWQSIDTISSCISSILGDESYYEDVWNGCCAVLAKRKVARKKVQNNSENEDIESDNEKYNDF